MLPQERKIVFDPAAPGHLAVALPMSVPRTSSALYASVSAKIIALAIRLDQLEGRRLPPGDPVPAARQPAFSWRPGRPLQRYIHEELLREPLETPRGPRGITFPGAPWCRTPVQDQLKRVLQHAARECMELIERERAAPQDRHGAAFVLALRPGVTAASSPSSVSRAARPAVRRPRRTIGPGERFEDRPGSRRGRRPSAAAARCR